MKFARSIAFAVVLVATIAVYVPGLSGGFMLDDFAAIHPIAAMQAVGADIGEALRAAPHHVRDRWIANATFALTNLVGGTPPQPDALDYKIGNLLIHLAVVAALFVFVRRAALASGAGAERAGWIALLAASVFALHPLLVSTVLYPVQRMAQLATLFLLLALHGYLRWRSSVAESTQSAHVVRLALVAGFVILAFFSKETGALAPLLVLVAEATLLRWPSRDDPARRRFEQGFGLLCAAPLVLGSVFALVRWKDVLAGYANRDFTVAERLLTQVHALASYLGQTVLPRIGSMGLYHDDFPLTSSLDASTAAWSAALAAIAVAAWWSRRRWPLVAFGTLWFFAAHAMESTLLPLELYYEHRNYLALVGPAVAVAAALAGWKRTRAAAGLAVLMLAFLAVATSRRAAEWSDYRGWLVAESSRRPASARAATDLYALHLQAGEKSDADVVATRLAAARPASAHPVLLRLGTACATRAGAMPLDDDALARFASGDVDKDLFHSYQGLLAMRLGGRCEGTAWTTFARIAGTIAGNPGLGANRTAVAAWHREAAQAAARAADWNGTAAHLESTLSARDDDPRDWLLLARARAAQGDRLGFLQARQRAQRLPGLPAEAFAELDAFAAGRLDNARPDTAR